MSNIKKSIKLSIDQAIELYKLQPEYRNTLLSEFTDKELNIEPNWPKTWIDLKILRGYYINSCSGVIKIVPHFNTTLDSNKNVFATEKQAKSALAFSQLSQIAKAMNGDWEPDWCNTDESKCVILKRRNVLELDVLYICFSPICFKTKEMAEFSFKHHLNLWKDYYELD